MKWKPGLVSAIVTGLLAGAAATGAAQEAERQVPVEVTGTAGPGPCSGPSRTVVDGIAYESGLSCRLRWEMSDPRLDGTVTWASNGGQDGSVEFGYEAISIENSDGSWRQRPVASFAFPGTVDEDVEYYVLDGDGDYDGLIALLTLVDDTESEADWCLQGYIIDGAFPLPRRTPRPGSARGSPPPLTQAPARVAARAEDTRPRGRPCPSRCRRSMFNRYRGRH